jgi:hypothetical protein
MSDADVPLAVLVARMLDEEARQRAPDIRRPNRQPRPRTAADHGVVPPPRRSEDNAPRAESR